MAHRGGAIRWVEGPPVTRTIEAPLRHRSPLARIDRSDEVVLCQHCRNRQARAAAALARSTELQAFPTAVARYRRRDHNPGPISRALAALARALLGSR